jgi:hypothetical protein
MTERCHTTHYPNGGYCVQCDEQQEIIGHPAYFEPVIDESWNSGANSISTIDGPAYFSFETPVDFGGIFGGIFDGSRIRDVSDPASIDAAIYIFAFGSMLFAQAYSFGTPIGAAIQIVPGEVMRIERPSEHIIFKAGSAIIAQIALPRTLYRAGGTLYRSGDRVESPVFASLPAGGAIGDGSASITFSAVGDSNSGYGSASVTFKASGETGSYGSASITFKATGSSAENYGSASITFRCRGYGAIAPPVVNYGSASITFQGTGDLHYPQSYATGAARIFFQASGSEFADYGSASITFQCQGSTAGDLTDFIIGLMSPGVSQLTMGYDCYNLDDGIRFNDGISTRLSMLLRESLHLADSMGTSASLTVILRDGLGLSDHWTMLFIETLADTMQLGDELSIRQALQMIDSLVLNGTIRTTLNGQALLATTLVLKDALNKVFVYNMDDTAILGDELIAAWNGKMQLIDSIVFDDSMGATLRISVLMNDSVALGDSIATQMQAVFELKDEIGFAIRLNTDNGVYIGYAMNTESRGATRYTNWPHNSYALVGSRLFGGSQGGLYAVSEGDDDDGHNIDAKLRTGVDNLGDSILKRMVKAYLGYRADGNLLLRIEYTSPGGQKTVETYRANRVLANDFRETNVDVGKKMKSVYWAFELSNEDGADFTLDAIKVIALSCEERSRG